MRVALTSRTFSDFNTQVSEILQFNFKRSIEGKASIDSFAHQCLHNAFLSVRSLIRLGNSTLSGYVNSMRAMTLDIRSDRLESASMLALRRRNAPLPPTGLLTVLKSTGELPLGSATLRRGDTTIIQLTAIGDFPSEPELVFAVKEQIGGSTLFVKTNKSIQGDIEVTDISPYISALGTNQKLTALITIYPGDTAYFVGRKVLFYTAEIVDKLADEVYTIETSRFTVEPDVYNYFTDK